MPAAPALPAHVPSPAESGRGERCLLTAPRWICPFCAEREVYETVADAYLREYAAQAYRQCIRDFGVPPDERWLTRLLTGLRPELVREVSDRRYDLYLQTTFRCPSAPVADRARGFPPRLLARHGLPLVPRNVWPVWFSIRLMDASDDPRPARICRPNAWAVPSRFPRPDSRRSTRRRPARPTRRQGAGEGVSTGRAFTLGEALIDAAGWPALCRLAPLERAYKSGTGCRGVVGLASLARCGRGAVVRAKSWTHRVHLLSEETRA